MPLPQQLDRHYSDNRDDHEQSSFISVKHFPALASSRIPSWDHVLLQGRTSMNYLSAFNGLELPRSHRATTDFAGQA
jgi:hypothetical protein